MKGPLPTDSRERKTYPLYRGLFIYGPSPRAWGRGSHTMPYEGNLRTIPTGVGKRPPG